MCEKGTYTYSQFGKINLNYLAAITPSVGDIPKEEEDTEKLSRHHLETAAGVLSVNLEGKGKHEHHQAMENFFFFFRV